MSATPDEIVRHWSRIEDECGLAVDWSEAHQRCWRCGYRSKLEKCHIVPAALGGPATPGNLVLLCGRCHREAPNHEDPKYLWRWLRATCAPLYDTYWTMRGMEEFETMFRRKPLDWLTETNLDGSAVLSEFRTLIGEEINRAIIHFGEGRLNPSTIACILSEIEQVLARRQGLVATTAGWAGRSPSRPADTGQLQPEVAPQPSQA